MSGYTPTHLGIPKNHADFERHSVVLFQQVLGDPGVKRLGRSGQRQYGIDLLGYRDGSLKKLVGIQCKKKQPNKALTTTEVRTEVRRALNYSPRLTEYIIVTTAPDDTNLDKLATQLTKQQRDKGRKIKIQVWGWDTLEDLIDRYPAAKEIFDPGASPALGEVRGKLDRIEGNQSIQATAEQLALLAAKVERRTSADDDRLPPKFADAELRVEIARINRRRGFAEAKSVEEWANLANRVLEGDLSRASSNLQADALERAARSHALPETVERAKFLHSEALKRDSHLDTAFYGALLPAAEGDAAKTIRALRQLDTPQSKSAILGHMIRTEGPAKALEWIKSAGLTITDLDAGGALNLILQRISTDQYEQALREAESLSDSHLKDLPAMRMVRSALLLSSALPRDQRRVPFQGIPIHPRMLQFNSLDSTPAALVKARIDLEAVLTETTELKLLQIQPFLEEQILWLKLETDATRQAARQQIEQEIKNPKFTLGRVRLALAYGIPFNQEALKRTLDTAQEFGKWTTEEQFAAFLLAWFNKDLSELAAFFDAYRDELYAQSQIDARTLLGIETQALARAHRFDDARARLAAGRGTILDDKTAAEMEELIASVEEGDETERLRKLYESSKDLTHLRLLIGAMVDKQDHRQLATYAPILLKESQRVADYDLSQKAMSGDGQYKQIIELAQAYPQLHNLRDDFLATEGWANFYLGRVMAARAIARTLVGRREDSGDRELDINTSIESGDWSHLQAIVAREAGRVEKLDAKLLMRLARIASESGSLYVDKFRDAAIEREPNSPEVLLAAYHMSVERGEEYQETRAHEWFQQAVALSGESGPVQTVSLKDVVARSAGWNKRLDDVDTMLADVKIPLYMAARSLNRQPVEFILGTAIRNAKSTDTKQQFAVLGFSGSRALFDLSGVRRLALDSTTIFTLEFLGLLQKTIDAFDSIVISPSTLSSLFADRQSIRFRQPSEVTKAREIKKLFASGRLKVLRALKTDAELAAVEIDPDLRILLDKARAENGVVVRSAPVHKLRSFLEEEADLTSYSDVLTDTHAALALTQNKISAPVASNASTYLSQVDKGWVKKQPLTKNSTVYLDQLAVSYLYHVGILEAFVGAVASAYVTQEVEEHCDAVIGGEEFSSDLLGSVERIRATLNAGLEKGNITFSARRMRRREDPVDSDDEMGVNFPSLDLLSDLSEIDAVAVDDRFLNKESIWNDGTHQAPCASTLEILIALNSRGVISEAQKYALLHRLREGGYYTVPTDVSELLSELNRSTIEGQKLLESKELFTIRTNLTIGLRSRMHSPLETAWLDYTRAVIVEALRRLWTEDSVLTSIIPRADWLLAAFSMPLRLLREPADNAQWTMTIQRTSAFIGLMLSPPLTAKNRQIEYSNWIEQRLAAPTRASQPALMERAIKTLAEFLKKLLEGDPTFPLNLRKRVVADLARSLHPNIERQLVDDSNIAATIGVKTTPVVVFNGTHTLTVESFVAALRSALGRRTKATIAMGDGSKRDVKLKLTGTGTVTIAFTDATFTFGEADLLVPTKAGRKRALKRVFLQTPLTAEEERGWLRRVEAEALTAKEYTDLLELLRETPESIATALSVPQPLGPEKMIPRQLSYYNRLVGSVQKAADFPQYLQHERKEHSLWLLDQDLPGLKRLACSAISRSLIPFEELTVVSLNQIAELLSAEDPFSLLFGFEVCQDRLSKGDKAAGALGTRFLKRLLGDKKWLQSRLELFSACAVIGFVALRPAANDPPPPLWWFRLAVLSHAGVLTTALKGIRKPADFLKWSARDFGPSYLWHTVRDAQVETRWESDWISPASLRAELLGRCYNALMQLPPTRQPKAWKTLVSAGLDSLDTKLLAFFPGPMDGFQTFLSPIQAEGALDEVRTLLKGRSSFKRTPGIILLAYAGAIDTRLKDEIFRLLNSSNEQLAKLKTADQVLRCCAYIAAINRDEELAKAVVARCLRLISPKTSTGAILQLLLISMHACAANADQAAYYREAAATATRFAYSVPLNSALEMRKVLETMKGRDLRLSASFGRAEAVLEAALLSA